jgi:predicted  nucleic acid-binding Zn-ribbon protein
MAGPAVVLREIHRLRRHARDLQDQVERGPRTLKAQQAKVARQEELLKEAHDAIKHLKVHTHEKEVTLRGKVQQASKHEKQLNEVKGKKEYDALQAEIAAEKRACGELEDEILADMVETEERTAKLPELEKAVQQAKEEADRFEQESQGRQASLTEQLNEVIAKLKQVENSLPEDARALYERLSAVHGEDALAAIHVRTCTACYTEITAQNYNELLQGQLVTCKSCGRIVYLPEQEQQQAGKV